MEQSRDDYVWETACLKEKKMVGEEMMLYIKALENNVLEYME